MNFSLALVNFSMISPSQLASLIIAICFSVLSLTMSLFAFKYAGRFEKKTTIVVFTLLFPFVAMTGWFFTIFSFVEWFRQTELANLLISIVLAGLITFMVVIVAKALFARYFNLTEEEWEARKEAKAAKKAAKREQKLLGYTSEQVEEAENIEEAVEENNEEIVVEENNEEMTDAEVTIEETQENEDADGNKE